MPVLLKRVLCLFLILVLSLGFVGKATFAAGLNFTEFGIESRSPGNPYGFGTAACFVDPATGITSITLSTHPERPSGNTYFNNIVGNVSVAGAGARTVYFDTRINETGGFSFTRTNGGVLGTIRAKFSSPPSVVTLIGSAITNRGDINHFSTLDSNIRATRTTGNYRITIPCGVRGKRNPQTQSVPSQEDSQKKIQRQVANFGDGAVTAVTLAVGLVWAILFGGGSGTASP